MTRTTTTTVAVAADYADAMITARRAKNWLFILLLLMLLVQIALFFVAKFAPKLQISVRSDPGSPTKLDVDVETSATQAVEAAVTSPADTTAGSESSASSTSASGGSRRDVFKYVVGLIVFLAPVLSILLAFVLLLITLIMLVGRLIGVSHVTSALIWCILLVLLLFPWQAYLEPFSFKIPGVIYTWEELSNAKILSGQPMDFWEKLLQWSRFAGFPIVALLILLSVQIKSSRGLKFALGEADVQVDLTPTL